MLMNHQTNTRSMDPSSRATNDVSSRNGKNTARFVAVVIVSRTYARAVVNGDSTARITPEWTTMAYTCLNDASPPIAALNTANEMPAISRLPTASDTIWITGVKYL